MIVIISVKCNCQKKVYAFSKKKCGKLFSKNSDMKFFGNFRNFQKFSDGKISGKFSGKLWETFSSDHS